MLVLLCIFICRLNNRSGLRISHSRVFSSGVWRRIDLTRKELKMSAIKHKEMNDNQSINQELKKSISPSLKKILESSLLDNNNSPPPLLGSPFKLWFNINTNRKASLHYWLIIVTSILGCGCSNDLIWSM